MFFDLKIVQACTALFIHSAVLTLRSLHRACGAALIWERFLNIAPPEAAIPEYDYPIRIIRIKMH